MAKQYIYMSVGAMEGNAANFDIKTTVLVNARTGLPNDLMRCRNPDGKIVGAGDPKGFQRMMAKSGHVVVLSPEFLGEEYMLRKPKAVDPKPAEAAK